MRGIITDQKKRIEELEAELQIALQKPEDNFQWRNPKMLKKTDKFLTKLTKKNKDEPFISMQERAFIEKRNYSDANLEL